MRKFLRAALMILVLAPCLRAEDETLAGEGVLAGLVGVGLQFVVSTDVGKVAPGVNLSEQKVRTKAELVLRRIHIPVLTEAEAREREGPRDRSLSHFIRFRSIRRVRGGIGLSHRDGKWRESRSDGRGYARADRSVRGP